jgi:serine protease Do
MRKILAGTFFFLAIGGSATQAQLGRRVQIINRSSSAIEYLHASNTDHPRWDEDLLGPMRVIPPGRSIDAKIDDGSGHCRFDLRAVLLDGREAVQPDFDVCANIAWTVNAGN